MSEPAPLPRFDERGNRERVARLLACGVEVWGPERVYVGADVPLENIQPGVVLMNAVITGKHSRIGAHSRIGISGISTIHDSQIGEKVEIGAGLFHEATLLDEVKVRGFAEFRGGTLLEEQAEVGHNVGLKNTVLTIAVVAGSLINFCDVLMTGGRSRKDHSEVGSGTVHFNFDSHGDKFGSLLGNASGLLLRSNRIFVGGNCGLVAPLHLDFGAVLAAGSTLRKDIAESQLVRSGEPERKQEPFDPDIYYDLRRKFLNTARLIGAMIAMRAWYRMVRIPFADRGRIALYQFADQRLATHIGHRANQLEKVIVKLDRSLSKQAREGAVGQFEKQHRLLLGKKEQICSFLEEHQQEPSPPPGDFVEEYGSQRLTFGHADAIKNLTEANTRLAAGWIQNMAMEPVHKMENIFQQVQP